MRVGRVHQISARNRLGVTENLNTRHGGRKEERTITSGKGKMWCERTGEEKWPNQKKIVGQNFSNSHEIRVVEPNFDRPKHKTLSLTVVGIISDKTITRVA